MNKLSLFRPVNLILLGLVQLVVAFGIWYPAILKSKDSSLLNSVDVVLLILCTMFIAASGYLINDYYDYNTDQINRPKKKILYAKLPNRFLLHWYFQLIIVGSFIALYLAIKIEHLAYFGLYAMALFLLWIYSKYLMKLPFIGNVVIAFFSAIFHLVFVVAELPIDMNNQYVREALYILVGFSVFAFLISLSREIIKDIEDIKGDMEMGFKTLPILINIRLAKVISMAILILLIAAILFWVLYLKNPLRIYAIIFLIIPILHLLKQTRKASSKQSFHELSSCHKLIMASGLIFLVLHIF